MPAPLSGSGADRNLLFGILALQLDFITRDQLVAAMNAWVLDKGSSLGQILVAQNVVTEARRALLEGLVQEHLEQHHGDAQQSLAAVTSDPSVRQQMEQIADADLHASLAHVPAPGGAETPDNTQPYT